MAPKKNNNAKKKDVKRKELTEEEMLRMGMSPDDIKRIIEERSKSTEEKKADQAKEGAQRREQEQRLRQQRETQKQVEELVEEEATNRGLRQREEERGWAALEDELAPQKLKVSRQAAAVEAKMRAEAARKRQEEELAAYQEKLKGMPEGEREAFIASYQEAERKKTEEYIAREEARRAKEERREARRKARLERMKNNENMDDLMSSDEEDGAGATTAKKGKQSRNEALEELEDKMFDRYAS